MPGSDSFQARRHTRDTLGSSQQKVERRDVLGLKTDEGHVPSIGLDNDGSLPKTVQVLSTHSFASDFISRVNNMPNTPHAFK